MLYDLEKRRSEFDILVIETTGIADPSAVAETFWTGSFMEKTYEVKHTICLADAQNILQSLTSADEAHRQIAFADVILLNKCDLIDTHQLDAVRHVLLDIHPGIRIFEGVEGIFPFELISQVKIHDIDRAETDYNTLSVKHESKHHGINTFTLMFDTPFDFGRLRHTLMLLLHVNKHQIYRIKGIIDVSDMDNRIILQSVYQSYRIQEGSEWKDDEVRNSKIVFIGHDVEKSSIERVLKTCLNKQTSSK
ncbi:MAG: GTP-binding protein [Saprospiraceae bacterium]|nr:GTP-binding protein [Saprospiraceae bacterium]